MNLVDLTLNEFVKKLAGDSPTPGGGSAAALAGGLGAALCSMVTRLTLGREKYRDVWEDMERIRDAADEHSRRLLELIESDTEAYNKVMAVFKLPKEDRDQKIVRQQAIQRAKIQAALVPMETLRTVADLVELVGEALDKGNPNCITDVGVAAQLIRASAMGAAYNVRINLSGSSDKDLSTRLKTEVNEFLARITNALERLDAMVEQGLS
jgi:formiminotetrahydrofolate cyclodeaminase